jgi:hypothetical protein
MVKDKSDTWLYRGALITAKYLHDVKPNLFDKFPFKNDLLKYCFVKYANLSSRYKTPYRLVKQSHFTIRNQTFIFKIN